MIMYDGSQILVMRLRLHMEVMLNQLVGRTCELLLSRGYAIALVWFGKYDHHACHVLRCDVSYS
jgi:hypothetical protein